MRKPIRLALLLAALAIVLASCQQEGLVSGNLILEGDHQLSSGESLIGVVFILDGSLSLEEGARVAGPVYMLAGRLASDGEITDDLSILGGEAILGPNAQIGGDLNLGGGNIQRSPQATISGRVNTGVGLQVPERPALFHETLRDQLPSFIVQAILLAGLAFIVVRWRPGNVRRVSKAMLAYPIVTGAMGLLAGVVALVLLVLIAFTIILIPVSLLFGFMIVLAIIFGWVALGEALGRLLVKRLKWNLTPGMTAALGTLLFVFLINALALIPLIEGLVPLIVSILALGAVFLTRFGLTEFVPASDLSEADF